MKKCINTKITKYLDSLPGVEVSGLHKMLMQKTEKILISIILQRNDDNQSKSAKELGINRSTLRKKINQYNLNSKKCT